MTTGKVRICGDVVEIDNDQGTLRMTADRLVLTTGKLRLVVDEDGVRFEDAEAPNAKGGAA